MKKTFKSILMLFLAMGLSFCFSTCSDDDDDNTELSQNIIKNSKSKIF